MLLAVVAVFLLPASAQAAKETVTLRFTELPLQPIDGVTINGLTFGFTIDGAPSPTGAFYNAQGPGQITFVQDPSLSGTRRAR